MALITLSEFKEVLGIGNIYADPIVQEVADAAEDIILSYLVFNQSKINYVALSANVATYGTTAPHAFAVGDSLVITGCGSPFNGTKTVTEKTAVTFKVAITNADIKEKQVKPTGNAIVSGQATQWDNVPAIREAALSVAVDIWITRQGTLGQQGVDFQPAPYRLSRSLMTRVSGLLAPYMNVENLIG